MGERVHQEDEDKLKATAYQGENFDIGDISAGTQTNDVNVTPGSGADMARKAYFDRNADLITTYWGALVAAHATTVRWTYTVPSNHKAIHSVFFGRVTLTIVTAGTYAYARWQVYTTAAGWDPYGIILHIDDGVWGRSTSVTATFAMDAGDECRGQTYHNDTVDHAFNFSALLTEFDE